MRVLLLLSVLIVVTSFGIPFIPSSAQKKHSKHTEVALRAEPPSDEVTSSSTGVKNALASMLAAASLFTSVNMPAAAVDTAMPSYESSTRNKVIGLPKSVGASSDLVNAYQKQPSNKRSTVNKVAASAPFAAPSTTTSTKKSTATVDPEARRAERLAKQSSVKSGPVDAEARRTDRLAKSSSNQQEYSAYNVNTKSTQPKTTTTAAVAAKPKTKSTTATVAAKKPQQQQKKTTTTAVKKRADPVAAKRTATANAKQAKANNARKAKVASANVAKNKKVAAITSKARKVLAKKEKASKKSLAKQVRGETKRGEIIVATRR